MSQTTKMTAPGVSARAAGRIRVLGSELSVRGDRDCGKLARGVAACSMRIKYNIKV